MPADFLSPMPPAPSGASTAKRPTRWPASDGVRAPGNSSATCTGSEMVVFGGTPDNATGLATGGRYSPAANSWLGATSPTGAPAPRYIHTAVWSGSEVIVWGGGVAGTPRDSGGRYDPGLDQWTPTNRSSTPAPRGWFASVWTGSEMLVWGGCCYRSSGAAYLPATDRWRTLSGSHGLSSVSRPSGVWTGSEMLVWGGYDAGANPMRNGGRYDPSADAWTAIPESGAPTARTLHTAIWSGEEMIVWGGGAGFSYLSDGAAYVPGGSWRPLPVAPTAGRYAHSAVWAGNEMIVWGGRNAGGPIDSGARYFPPPVNAWSVVNGQGAPSARSEHTAVWTGGEMVVWGGIGSSGGNVLGSGGRYRPALDSWQPTNSSIPPAARYGHTAVWSGAEIIVWGGSANTGSVFFESGARYLPVADAWQPTTLSGAPAPRYTHGAIWSGTRMIVWGGYPDTATGGAYCALLGDLLQDGFESGGLDSWSAVRP